MSRRYKATQDGGVIDTLNNTLVYEPLPDIPAKEIASVLNDAYDNDNDLTDWRDVEKELFKRGVISELRA